MICPDCLRADGHWPACSISPPAPAPLRIVASAYVTHVEQRYGDHRGRWSDGSSFVDLATPEGDLRVPVSFRQAGDLLSAMRGALWRGCLKATISIEVAP